MCSVNHFVVVVAGFKRANAHFIFVQIRTCCSSTFIYVYAIMHVYCT